MVNQFVYPWLRKQKIQCPKCGGIIETYPLLPGQEKNLEDLEQEICHKITPELLALLPRLSQANCKSRDEWLLYKNECPRLAKNCKEIQEYLSLVAKQANFANMIVRYGIFPLIEYLSVTELIALFLLWCLEDEKAVKPVGFIDIMGLSRARISGILKTLRLWSQLTTYSFPNAKPKARGRLRGYSISSTMRNILNEDFEDHLFFGEIIRSVILPFVKANPNHPWRKDLFGENNSALR